MSFWTVGGIPHRLSRRTHKQYTKERFVHRAQQKTVWYRKLEKCNVIPKLNRKHTQLSDILKTLSCAHAAIDIALLKVVLTVIIVTVIGLFIATTGNN